MAAPAPALHSSAPHSRASSLQVQRAAASGAACRYGVPLRVAEANTISDSGLRGVSDVFTSALWAIDATFETAQAGSIGINFHQGAGQNVYSAFVPAFGKGGPLIPKVGGLAGWPSRPSRVPLCSTNRRGGPEWVGPNMPDVLPTTPTTPPPPPRDDV